MANFISKNIPNTLTSCNLISGGIATVFAIGGDVKMALIWIIVGAVFDFFDGMSARLLNVSSPIGKELDSLADDITFGLAPSAIVFNELYVMDYPSLLEPWREYIPFLAFIMAAFSALRLAKFNLDTRQATSFIGLPTPANALFWGSLLVTRSEWVEASPYNVITLVVMLLFSSWLLVCELPMFALKFKHWGWEGNALRYSFIAISAVLIVWQGVLESFWMIILLYIIISVVDDSMLRHGKGKGELA